VGGVQPSPDLRVQLAGLLVKHTMKHFLATVAFGLLGGMLGACMAITLLGSPMTWPLSPLALQLLIGMPLAGGLAGAAEVLISAKNRRR
jgi:hypothetical protein